MSSNALSPALPTVLEISRRRTSHLLYYCHCRLVCCYHTYATNCASFCWIRADYIVTLKRGRRVFFRLTSTHVCCSRFYGNYARVSAVFSPVGNDDVHEIVVNDVVSHADDIVTSNTDVSVPSLNRTSLNAGRLDNRQAPADVVYHKAEPTDYHSCKSYDCDSLFTLTATNRVN